MKIICAWCKSVLGEKEPFDEDSITHSICLTCKDKVLKQAIEEKTKNMPRQGQIINPSSPQDDSSAQAYFLSFLLLLGARVYWVRKNLSMKTA